MWNLDPKTIIIRDGRLQNRWIVCLQLWLLRSHGATGATHIWNGKHELCLAEWRWGSLYPVDSQNTWKQMKVKSFNPKTGENKKQPIYVNGDGKFWFWWFNSSSSLVSLYPFWLWQTDKNKIKGLGSILSSILRGVWFQVNWMKYFLSTNKLQRQVVN